MSGVTGSDKVSRKDFNNILARYEKEVLKTFKPYVAVDTSGSYNSRKDKNLFGDMDLLVQVKGFDSKPEAKKDFIKHIKRFSDAIIVPFTSKKYAGKKWYNSGEIVTVAYPQVAGDPSSTVQIDNIFSLDGGEQKYKRNFLDMPAEKQGLVLGLAKIALIEQPLKTVAKKVGINPNIPLAPNQELEFNVSGVEIQLRRVTYDAELLAKGTFRQKGREVMWKSRDWKDLNKILYKFDLSLPYEKFMPHIKKVLKQKRSKLRIAGIFKSMISVKSGEVGTEKGAVKQAALDAVAKVFGEGVSEQCPQVPLKSFKGFLLDEGKKDSVGIYVGRFQPVTKAHEKIAKMVGKNHDRGIVYLVKGKKSDPKKNPFDEDLQIKMLEKVVPPNVSVEVLPSAFFVDEINMMPEEDFTIYAGSDRIKQYARFAQYLDDGKNLNTKEIKRTGKDISATKVRKAIADGDEDTFKSMTPKAVHPFFQTLQQKL